MGGLVAADSVRYFNENKPDVQSKIVGCVSFDSPVRSNHIIELPSLIPDQYFWAESIGLTRLCVAQDRNSSSRCHGGRSRHPVCLFGAAGLRKLFRLASEFLNDLFTPKRLKERLDYLGVESERMLFRT